LEKFLSGLFGKDFWMIPHILSRLSWCVRSSASAWRQELEFCWTEASLDSTMNSIIFSILHAVRMTIGIESSSRLAQHTVIDFPLPGFALLCHHDLMIPSKRELQLPMVVAVVWANSIQIQSPISVRDHHLKVFPGSSLNTVVPVDLV